MLDVKVGDGAFMKTLDDARVAGRDDARARPAGRPRGRLPADRHGPAARARRRERARDPRGASRRSAARARPTSPSSCLGAARRCSRCSDLGVDEAEGRAPRRGGRRGRRRARPPTSAGSGRRAATPTRRCSRAAPVVRAVAAPRGRLRRAGSVRSGVGRAALHLGAGRADEGDAIDHAVGVVCLRKRGDAVAAGRRAGRDPRSRRGGCGARRGRGSGRIRGGRVTSPIAGDRARDDRLGSRHQSPTFCGISTRARPTTRRDLLQMG